VRRSEAPHVFWTADYAYRNLLDTRLQQCIVVNGDSGAGKTENTKYALKHLTHISPCQVPDLVDKISRVKIYKHIYFVYFIVYFKTVFNFLEQYMFQITKSDSNNEI